MRTENTTYLLGADPKVTLLYATPEWVVAQATQGYAQVYSSTPMSAANQAAFWAELGATKLKGPLEMAQCFFLFERVSRPFTLQLARYRIGASMVQESQRFSVQDANKAQVMVPKAIAEDSEALEGYMESAETAMQTYMDLVDTRIVVQDARGILPTNICTRLYYMVNLATLKHIYNQRSCCQAQHDEWEPVLHQIKAELVEHDFLHYAAILQAPWEDEKCINCGFGSQMFDRPCEHAEKFENNLRQAYAKL